MGYISEDYCSEELSGMLMEKGYIGATNTYLGKDDINVEQITIQSAMKWLREVHGIHISITPLSFEDGIFWMYKIIKLWSDNNCSELHRSDSRVGFNTYEEVCEAAIKYCLENLI